ncbi:MAG TPA: hypothetical protein VEK57_07235, partial [Thermoanaerobaculia bacterium]|nr:hypothetical protein [Thermoanaerobaculia bacterium]
MNLHSGGIALRATPPAWSLDILRSVMSPDDRHTHFWLVTFHPEVAMPPKNSGDDVREAVFSAIEA